VCCDAGDGLVDVVSVDAPGGGGKVVASSSAHYSVPSNMLKAPRALNMGDGWETARMRGQPDYGVFHLEGPVLSDYNWTLFKLSQECVIKKIGVDTLHFKHNNPIAFSLEGCYEPGLTKDNYHSRGIKYALCVCVRCALCGGYLIFAWNRWTSLVKPKALQPHLEHPFDAEHEGRVTHVLLKIYPCGGISRLRLFGKPAKASAL
jgi:allantoicase